MDQGLVALILEGWHISSGDHPWSQSSSQKSEWLMDQVCGHLFWRGGVLLRVIIHPRHNNYRSRSG
jgi:hypothetical protein